MSEFLARRRPRPLTAGRLGLVLAALLALTALVSIGAILLGVAHGPGGRSLELLPWESFTSNDTAHQILWLRIGRVLGGLLVGAALGAAGCALQALLRNPLAEPYTLGVSSGSALLAVLAIRLGLDRALGELGIAGAALAGAALALAAIWQLGRIGRELPPATLVLAGVAVSMFCSAASLLVQATADFTEISRMLRWMMGGLEGRSLGFLGAAAAPIGLGLVLLLGSARSLDALAAGEDAAASLGVAVGRTQRLVLAVAALLVGVSIALGGPIGFVGLVVPHGLRALLGSDHRLLLPASALAGGALVVACDVVARLAIAPAQLPTGAITALIGGPFFLAILVAHKRSASLWGSP